MIERIMRNFMAESDALEIIGNPDIRVLMPGVKIIEVENPESICLSRIFDFDTPEFERFAEYIQNNLDFREGGEAREKLNEYIGSIFIQTQLLRAVMDLMNQEDDHTLLQKGKFVERYSQVITTAYYDIIQNDDANKIELVKILCMSFECNKYYDDFMHDAEEKSNMVPTIIGTVLTYMNLVRVIPERYANVIMFSANRVLVMYSRKDYWDFAFDTSDEKLMQSKIITMTSAIQNLIENPDNPDNFDNAAAAIDDASDLLQVLLNKYGDDKKEVEV
jgi:hypothetical protein